MEKTYSVEDVKRILGIGNAKAYALFKSSDFRSFKVGNSYRIFEKDFIDWIEQNIEHERRKSLLLERC